MDEPGYTEEEVKRGENQAWHIPPRGCLFAIAAVALIIWAMFEGGMFMHGDPVEPAAEIGSTNVL